MTESITEVERPVETEDDTLKPQKKLRWAPHRLTGVSDKIKRQSTDFSKKHSTLGKLVPESVKATNGDDTPPHHRRIYINEPLPPSELDENGNPLYVYTRNKIRTSKYTPFSFIPKNLWFQFHNIANIYFLFTIVLSVSTRSISTANKLDF